MTDLISREALLAAVQAGEHTTDTIVQIETAPAVKPQVVANITGGMLQGASSDYPIDIYCLDFDVDSFDETAVGVIIDGDGAYFGQESTEVDPDFVRKVIEAPEVYLFDGKEVE